MTNFEKIIKEQPELVKEALSEVIAKQQDQIIECISSSIRCSNCDFYPTNPDMMTCKKIIRQWLDVEVEPTSKRLELMRECAEIGE